MATAAAHNSTTAHAGGMPIATQMSPSPPKLVESNTVATQFVQQYYHVLSNWPENLHRFYTDASTLSHSVVGEETVHTQTQRAIHEKVMGLGLQGAVPQILSVDSQNSIGGGVVVHTTGFLTLKGTKPRPFAQVFFLAQQEIGYYVLNDLFCWLQKEERINLTEDQVRAPVPAPAVKQGEEQQKAPSEEKKKSVSASATGNFAEDSKKTAESQRPEKQAPAPATATQREREVTKNQQTEMPSEIDLDAPMTYAQRLKMAAAKAPAAETAPAAAPGSEDGASPTPNAEENKESPAALVEGMQQGRDDDIDSCSIFVRNLPPSITDEVLLAEFSKLGPVEGGLKGVSLKNLQKGNPYAFVHFCSPQIAARVLGAKIEIAGKQLEIAEKKPSIINRSKKVQNVGNRGHGRGGTPRNQGASGEGRGNNNGGKFSGRQKASNARGMGKMNSNGRNQGQGKAGQS